MGWISRLFGREKQFRASSDLSRGVDSAKDLSGKQQRSEMVGAYDRDELHSVIRHALSPVLAELEQISERLNVISSTPDTNARRLADGVNSETMQRAIEYALAHMFRLLQQRGAGITVPAAILGKTPDGNTVLPFEPMFQYLLLVMNPLFPGLYSIQVILPSTFTKVDQLALLPNGVQTKALHINTKKAPPGFVEAIRLLQQNNANNLYLGMIEASQDATQHNLQYYPCTGSDLRNTAPDKYPDDLMLYFNTQPKPIIVQRHIPNVDEIFASLHELEAGTPSWLSRESRGTEQIEP